MLRDMPEFMLEIVEGPEAGRQVPLTGPLELGSATRRPARPSPRTQPALPVMSASPRWTTARGSRISVRRNGTFVDGDQIFSLAFLAPEGQLLVGVSLLQLRPASGATVGYTAVRQIPTSLTAFRPLPTQQPAVTAARQVPTLATDEAEPDYVPASAVAAPPWRVDGPLDVHTKGKARVPRIRLLLWRWP